MYITLAGGSPSCLLFLSIMSVIFVFVFFSCIFSIIVNEDGLRATFLGLYALALVSGFFMGWQGILSVLFLAMIVLFFCFVNYLDGRISGKGRADKDQDKTATYGKTHDWPSTGPSTGESEED